MKYLFFDIECANCFDNKGKICEFGYLITDEQFNIIERKEILVNPNHKFDWYVVKKMLNHKREEYLQAGIYPEYYDEISKLFSDSETLIFGHTIDTDAKYLNDESKRYQLPYINFEFYDIKEIYKLYKPDSSGPSLERMSEILGLGTPDKLHSALSDAKSTMDVLKKLCEDMNITVAEIIERAENPKGNTSYGVVSTSYSRNNKSQNRSKKKEREVDNRKYKEPMKITIGDIFKDKLSNLT